MCSSMALRVKPCLQVDEGSHWGALTSKSSICLGASETWLGASKPCLGASKTWRSESELLAVQVVPI